MATMTAMQIAGFQNDIAKLHLNIIDLQAQIKKIVDETIPNLEKQKTRIVEQKIPDLEAQKRHLLEETIPQKNATIKKLLEITIPKMAARIEQIKLENKPPYLTRTAIVGDILTHDHPVKPRKKLIVALAGILGLMLGVFLAFFREFLSREATNKIK
jgi:LPS O-antigen subunit length determinant protein (WzzB/FepE family)